MWRTNRLVFVVHGCVAVCMSLMTACSVGEIKQIVLPDNMTPFKDEARKMEFMTPAGWQQAAVDPVIEKSTLGIRKGAPVAFRKGDRGMFTVWCDRYDSSRPTLVHLGDVIDAYAPLNKPIPMSGFEVDAPETGWMTRALVRSFNASQVVKGDKRDFLLLAVKKDPPVAKAQTECTYLIIARSSTDTYNEEIKADVSAVAATLQNHKDTPVTADTQAEAVKRALAKMDKDAIVKKISAQAIENIKQKQLGVSVERAGDYSPMQHDDSVRWQVIASDMEYNDLKDVRYIAPARLLVSVDGRYPRLINTDDGRTVWVLKEENSSYTTGYRDLVYFRIDDTAGSSLAAVETAKGNVRWKADLKKGGALHVIPFPAIDVIMAVRQDKNRASIIAFKGSSGDIAWEGDFDYGSSTADPPVPASNGTAAWLFYDGVAKLSAATGKVEWRRDEIRAGTQSPPLQLSGDRLYVLDGTNTFHVLDARTGKTLAGAKHREGAVYTNIYPLGDRVYLRGVEKGKSNEPVYFVSAARSSDGKELWADVDKAPSVSSLIEEDGTLYHATPTTVIALDRETGARRFTAQAATTGKTFPVQIRKYGNSIVYLGELVIAAFDAKTGEKVYRYGFDPVDQLAHLDALNMSIESTAEFISMLSGPLSGWNINNADISGFMLAQARNSQSQSLYRSQESVRLRNEASSSLKSGSEKEQLMHRSEVASSQAKIESAMADAQMATGNMFMTVGNMQAAFARVTGPDRIRLERLMRMRRLLYAAYGVMQQGDYAYRPTKSPDTGDDISLETIHLPSGKRASTKLHGADGTRGFFSYVDVERGIAYYPGNLEKPRKTTCFIAQPVAMPK